MPRQPGTPLVLGTGPKPARVLLAGEAPGPREAEEGKPFVGKAGEALSMFLAHIGLERSQVYITNLVKFWPGPRNPDPDPADIRRDEWMLEQEMLEVQPKVVVALGRFSLRWFLGADAEMELCNGVPHATRFPGVVCIGVFHPALGLHDPARAAFTYWGMEGLASYLRGATKPWTESKPAVRMRLLALVNRLVVPEPAAVDTEGTLDAPFSVQWTVDGVDGCMVPANRARHLEFTGKLTFHNAKHDIQVLRAMGVRFPQSPRLWEDTMVRAYVRQDQPQGLKALAYRVLSRRMQTYEQLTKPHQDRAQGDWLARAATIAEQVARPPAQLIEDRSTGHWRFYRPQAIAARIQSALLSWQKDHTVDLGTRWQAIPLTMREPVEQALGPFPQAGIKHVPLEQALGYAVDDALSTHALERAYRVPVALQRTYRLDLDIIPTLVEMEENGLPFSVPAAQRLSKQLEWEARGLRRTLRRLAGLPWLNPASTQQVGAVLFQRWGVASPRRTKLTGNDSSDDRALSTLKLQYEGSASPADQRVHQFITLLQDYRERRKMIGTYVGPEALPAQCKDGYVHATLKNTRTASGRLASEAPNLQNIPIRSELGKRIRACFIAPAGWCLLSGDLSQIELRLAAHESQDTNMIEVFQQGADLHRMVERSVFGIPDEQAGTKRVAAKTFSFRVMYAGPKGSPDGLREQLFLDGVVLGKQECAEYRDRWFALYPGVRRYLEAKAEEARRLAYVQTAGGRRRYLPFTRLDAVPGARAEAERQAGNHGIQGGAQEVIKRAMRRWDVSYRERANKLTRVLLCMQIHDELMFLVKGEPASPQVHKVAGLVQEMLEADSADYRVPILAECKVGQVWGEQTSLKLEREVQGAA